MCFIYLLVTLDSLDILAAQANTSKFTSQSLSEKLHKGQMAPSVTTTKGYFYDSLSVYHIDSSKMII